MARKRVDGRVKMTALQMGELSDLLGYSLKRAQLKVFEDFLRCVAPLQLTPAQFSVLLLLDGIPAATRPRSPIRSASCDRISSRCSTLESRDLCTRMRSTNDRRSHILMLTEKGRAVLARAKKLVATKHEARLNELLGPTGRVALLRDAVEDRRRVLTPASFVTIKPRRSGPGPASPHAPTGTAARPRWREAAG